MASFSVTYAGVPVLLTDPDGRVEAWLRSPLGLDLLPKIAPAYEGKLFRDQWPMQQMGGVGSQNYHPLPPWKVNTLIWPMGANRPAYCLLLMTADDLQRVYDKDGETDQPFRDFEIKVDDEVAVFAEMTYLPPIQVSAASTDETQDKGQGDLYVLPIVDRRYEMQHMSTSLLQEDGNAPLSTWGEYADNKSNATMGAYFEEVDTDTISQIYIGPDVETFYRSMTTPGVFLDAMAASLGGQWVAFPTKDEKNSLHLARWENYIATAGREGLPDTFDNPLIAGQSPKDGVSQLFASFPESYQVTFPVYKWGGRCRRYYTAEWNLDDLELDIQLDRTVKRTGFIQSIYTTAHANHSKKEDGAGGGGDIDNQAKVDALSKQLAKDAASRSMPHPTVQVFAGIYPLDPTGGEDAGDNKLRQLAWADRVEFCFDRGQCFTRWVGLPHSYGPHFNLSQFNETPLYTSPAVFGINSSYPINGGTSHGDGWNAELSSTNPPTHGAAAGWKARVWDAIGVFRNSGACIAYWNIASGRWEVDQMGCS